MENKLEEIRSSDFVTLRDLYKVEWPKYILASNLFQIIRQKNKSCTKVFSLNGDWSDGTFVAVMGECEIMFATLDPTYERLKKALHLIDYQEMKMFLFVRLEYQTIIEEVIKEKGLTCTMKQERGLQFLSKENAMKLKLEIPRKFSLRPLTKKNAAKRIDYRRVFNTEIKIKTQENIGLFNDKFEVIDACYQLPFGSLGPLLIGRYQGVDLQNSQTVTVAMCQKIVQDWNLDVTSNESNACLTSLGFQAIQKTITFELIKYDPEYRLEQLRGWFSSRCGVPLKLLKNTEFL